MARITRSCCHEKDPGENHEKSYCFCPIFFIFAGVVYAENLNCRVVLRDMYAGDSQKTQNLLVPMLKNNELDGVTKLLSSGAVTLFEAGEKDSSN